MATFHIRAVTVNEAATGKDIDLKTETTRIKLPTITDTVPWILVEEPHDHPFFFRTLCLYFTDKCLLCLQEITLAADMINIFTWHVCTYLSHNEEDQNICCSPNIVTIIRSKRMRLTGQKHKQGHEKCIVNVGWKFWREETTLET